MTDSNGASIFDIVRQTRKPSARGGSQGGLVIDDGDMYPCLTHILTQLPKGAMKGAKAGRIGWYEYNGRLSCAVNVPAMKSCGFYTVEGFTDAFQRLETALREGKVDWREDK